VLRVLNQLGHISDTDLAALYGQVSSYAVASKLPDIEPDQGAVLSHRFMQGAQCLLLDKAGPLYVVNPFDEETINGAMFGARKSIADIQILPLGLWQKAMQALRPDQAEAIDASDLALEDLSANLSDQDRDAPVVRQVAAWLADAAEANASDVHFDVRRDRLDVQYRVDGRLRSIANEPKANAASIIARIKVIADLDLGERYKSQDGRATLVVRGRRLDVRVSIVPTIEGESAVVRLLDRPQGLLSLPKLGFDAATVSTLQSVMQKKHGLFIVAGPTGSGKTTTLYACLETLRGSGLKILSVEDPVEYQFTHVNQVQVSEKAGRTFAGSLRSFLRHDPDVIMVGEIRDTETAITAVQAALTGHLVIATLHAIDTARVRTRLIDMGVEAFRLDACLTGALAQRLVRQLCPDCKTPRELTPLERDKLEAFGVEGSSQVYEPVGCAACYDDGYRGRIVLSELHQAHTQDQDVSLAKNALELFASGDTSLSEIVDLIS
jgi:general secretion pathway protein E